MDLILNLSKGEVAALGFRRVNLLVRRHLPDMKRAALWPPFSFQICHHGHQGPPALTKSCKRSNACSMDALVPA
jgi:hypothetical protein